MALVQLSSNLENIKGSIGRITFSKGRSGIIEKHKSEPGSEHPFTPSQSQLLLRDSIRTLSPIWKTLLDGQRLEWNQLASTILKHNEFGEPCYSSGFNTFIECNHNRYLIGLSFILDAPSYPSFSGLTSFQLEANNNMGGGISLILPSPGTSSNVEHLVFCTDSLSPGKSYIRNQYRFIFMLPHLSSGNVNFTLPYKSIFPVLIHNLKIFCKLRPIEKNTGFSGPNVFSNSIVSS